MIGAVTSFKPYTANINFGNGPKGLPLPDNAEGLVKRGLEAVQQSGDPSSPHYWRKLLQPPSEQDKRIGRAIEKADIGEGSHKV